MRGQEPGSEHDRREADGSATPATPPPSFGQTSERDVPPAFSPSEEAADGETSSAVPTFTEPPPDISRTTEPSGTHPWEVPGDEAAPYDWYSNPTDPNLTLPPPQTPFTPYGGQQPPTSPTDHPRFGAATDDPPLSTPADHPRFGTAADGPPLSTPTDHPRFGAADDGPPLSTPADHPRFGAATDHPPFGTPTDHPRSGAAADGPPLSTPAERPPFSAPADHPSFGAAADLPPFSGPTDRPPFGAATDHPPFGTPDVGHAFSAQPDRPPFGAPGSDQPPFGAPQRDQPPSSAPEAEQAWPGHPQPPAHPHSAESDQTRPGRLRDIRPWSEAGEESGRQTGRWPVDPVVPGAPPWEPPPAFTAAAAGMPVWPGPVTDPHAMSPWPAATGELEAVPDADDPSLPPPFAPNSTNPEGWTRPAHFFDPAAAKHDAAQHSAQEPTQHGPGQHEPDEHGLTEHGPNEGEPSDQEAARPGSPQSTAIGHSNADHTSAGHNESGPDDTGLVSTHPEAPHGAQAPQGLPQGAHAPEGAHPSQGAQAPQDPQAPHDARAPEGAHPSQGAHAPHGPHASQNSQAPQRVQNPQYPRGPQPGEAHQDDTRHADDTDPTGIPPIDAKSDRKPPHLAAPVATAEHDEAQPFTHEDITRPTPPRQATAGPQRAHFFDPTAARHDAANTPSTRPPEPGDVPVWPPTPPSGAKLPELPSSGDKLPDPRSPGEKLPEPPPSGDKLPELPFSRDTWGQRSSTSLTLPAPQKGGPAFPPGAFKQPPFQTQPPPPPPPAKSKRALLVTLGALALAGVATGGFFAFQAMSAPTPTTAAARATTSAPPTATERSTPPPADGAAGTSMLNTETTDPQKLSLSEAFPSKKVSAAGTTFNRVKAHMETTCDRAAIGAFADALKERKCSRVLRATYVDSKRRYAVTTGIAVLPDKDAATAADQAKDLSRNVWFRGLPGSTGSGGERVHIAGGYAAGLVWGRYIVFSYATHADGHTPEAKDKTLPKVSGAFRDHTSQVLERRITKG
ncbi:hypothetical protein AB0I81_58835 [Nonomuraea sp. NPDC050404]|uniref:hypothetical protein n=1 Tax=Nonomuraea sp. NPDC050404 TaxID=3155783 RepID=UPI0033CA9A9B